MKVIAGIDVTNPKPYLRALGRAHEKEKKKAMGLHIKYEKQSRWPIEGHSG